VESGERQQLSQPRSEVYDARPTYSPDGASIAFSRGPSSTNHDLFLMPAEGGTPRQVTHEARRIWGFDWTGDGRSMVMASNRRGPFQLWRVPLDGGEPTWIPVAAQQVRFPAVTGSNLVFDEHEIRASIWSTGLEDGSGPVERLRSNQRDSSPSHSPDGTRLAFVSNRSGTAELWLAESAEKPRRLTHLQASFLLHPKWSPDGRFLAVSGVVKTEESIFLVDSVSGTARPLEEREPGQTQQRRIDRHPTWSATGKTIYFYSSRGGSWNLWRIPIRGGEAELAVKDGAYGVESPDGSTLYFTQVQKKGVWSQPTAGGPETLVVGDIEPRRLWNWVLHQGGLYYTRARDNGEGVDLVRLSLESGEQQVVFPLPMGFMGTGFSVSPVDGSICYSRYSGIESDLRLISDFR
ncbi:MAG: hypothetical protein MI919_16370, partial [Holophagales bacterium]|nr:hypothetical protein [Holophagales bacterium]